jgi:hypothetical protein
MGLGPVVALLACCSAAPSGRGAGGSALACDAAWWGSAAQRTSHAWLLSLDSPHRHPVTPSGRFEHYGNTPVSVLETDGDDVRVAIATPRLIVTRWVPTSALGRAAMAKVWVSPRADSPPDPAVRILVGYQLPEAETPWLSVRQAELVNEGIELSGVVPAAVRGVVWDEPRMAMERPGTVHLDAVIVDAPHAGASVRARVSAAAAIEVRGDHGGWLEVTARSAHAEVDGFLQPAAPRSPPDPPGGTHDFSDDVIEPEPAPPAPERLPVGTCLHDAPGGNVVGMILGEQPADPEPTLTTGWYELQLATPWGELPYFIYSPSIQRLTPEQDTAQPLSWGAPAAAVVVGSGRPANR